MIRRTFGCLVVGVFLAATGLIAAVYIPHSLAQPPHDATSDKAALLVMAQEMFSESCASASEWNTEKPVQQWRGVKLNDAGRVVSLSLDASYGSNTRNTDFNCLTGTIPSEIGNLTELTHLNLSRNYLTGTIPSEIGNLTKLTHLNLSRNYLTGTIPSEIGNLTKLTHLNLSTQFITGAIPSEIGNLKSLEVLKLDNNNLTGTIPPKIGELKQIFRLQLENNYLDGLMPPQLGNLSNLHTLNLNNNRLTGAIPTQLGNLNNLNTLNLASNQLTGPIPTQLGNLNNLNTLNLASNQLTGPIPTQLGSLNNLQYLNLASNQLTGNIPEELGESGNWTHLEYLSVRSNLLTGIFPSKIMNNVRIKAIDVRGNYNPSEIRKSAADQDLCFLALETYKWATGEQPKQITRWRTTRDKTNALVTDQDEPAFMPLCMTAAPGDDIPTLDSPSPGTEQDKAALITIYNELRTNRNQLNWAEKAEDGSPLKEWDGIGTNPAGRVTQLDLGKGYDTPNSNRLSGRISPAIGDLTALVAITLQNNNLSGPIPSSIGNLERLTSLDLHSNNLAGSLPSSIGAMTRLQSIKLYETHLQGAIPAEIGRLTNLTSLNLYGNTFSGDIPNLNTLTKLEYLDLGENRLSGYVTENTFGDIKSNFKAGSFDISHNSVAGDISNVPAGYITDIVYNRLHGDTDINFKIRDGEPATKRNATKYANSNSRMCYREAEPQQGEQSDANVYRDVRHCIPLQTSPQLEPVKSKDGEPEKTPGDDEPNDQCWKIQNEDGTSERDDSCEDDDTEPSDPFPHVPIPNNLDLPTNDGDGGDGDGDGGDGDGGDGDGGDGGDGDGGDGDGGDGDGGDGGDGDGGDGGDGDGGNSLPTRNPKKSSPRCAKYLGYELCLT